MLEIFKNIEKAHNLSLGLSTLEVERVANISDFASDSYFFLKFAKNEEVNEDKDDSKVPIYIHRNIIITGSGKIFVTTMKGDNLKKFITDASCVAFLESSLGENISLCVYDKGGDKIKGLIRDFTALDHGKNKAGWLHDGKWKEYLINLDEEISKKIKEKEEEMKKEKERLLKNNCSKLEKMF